MNLFRRSEAAPKPLTVVKSERPVTIRKDGGRVSFWDNATGNELTKADAITLMRAYKAAQGSKGSTKPSPRQTPKASPKRKLQEWTVAVYRTDLRSGNSTLIEEAKASTFLAAATKLASLCMQHQGDKRSAVEVLIEQVA